MIDHVEEYSVDLNQKPFRVLCIDGGGMRGLYSLCVLEGLAKRLTQPLNGDELDLGKAFDLVVGTSTGAIQACGLAAGISTTKMQELYVKHGRSIFPDPMPSKKGGIWFWLWVIRHISKPSANASRLRDALFEAFGKETLEQVYGRRKIALCVPAIRGSNFKSLVFKTPHGNFFRDKEHSLVNVCLASSAAPSFFPLHKIMESPKGDKDDVFIDGGLWANTPVLVGLAEAVQLSGNGQAIEILSIGNCAQPSGDPSALDDCNWGLKKWRVGIEMLNASISAQAMGHKYIAEVISNAFCNLGKRVMVYRLPETAKSPDQFSAIGLDKADERAIRTLRAMAESDVDEANSKMVRSQDPFVIPFREILSTVPLKNVKEA